MEQVCHKPPISYTLLEGPNDSYRYNGYASLSVKAQLNSIYLEAGGEKSIKFPDGSQITFNNQNDIFGNTLIGTFHHQLVGTINFVDEKNRVSAAIKIGQEKGKPKDYLQGEILQDGEPVAIVQGNYMGYIDARDHGSSESKRYFDVRQLALKKVVPTPIEASLSSDSRNRPDSQELQKDNVEQAQSNKESMEKIQRNDRALREAAAKRRQNGGPRIVFKYD